MKIYICSNLETIQNCEEFTEDEAQEIIEEGTDYLFRKICDLKTIDPNLWHRLEYHSDCNYQKWHGGTHYKLPRKRCEWGYSAGWVVTHEQNPSKIVCDICDAAQECMDKKAAEINQRYDT
tara:strand:- start:293 stop:655 length:363 start_codon:yes stop_codon:yes gene_type:complete